jgi:Rne/Rng family ribonuclease
MSELSAGDAGAGSYESHAVPAPPDQLAPASTEATASASVASPETPTDQPYGIGVGASTPGETPSSNSDEETTPSSSANRRRRRRRSAGQRDGDTLMPSGESLLDVAVDDAGALVSALGGMSDREGDAGSRREEKEAAVSAGSYASSVASTATPSIEVTDEDSLDGPPAELGAGADHASEPGPVGGARGPRGPQVGDTRPAARPRIGDTRPAPPPAVAPHPVPTIGVVPTKPVSDVSSAEPGGATDAKPSTPRNRSRRRSGRERRGRPVGRYLMCVHVRSHATQIAVLEGRTLVEHYVSRASDDATQIDGNIYRGRVQNVLPGMEAAFVDIGTPKNAVLYRGDVRYDRDDVETGSGSATPRIEQMLKPGQLIVCQVTKNPIGAKGARLTQEVSLPGRFVVMVPDSSAFGISKRLDDNERRRLRRIVDDTRPEGHGLIVRTAAEGATREELANDVNRLLGQWAAIEEEARRSNAPGLLYREPDLAVRIVREEFNREYRGVVIDDLDLFTQVHDYVQRVNPELADRVEYYDPMAENLPIFERFHVHEQLHKALDRKVWLPSGGSIIIERTEALTVIDVNTGKNVGTSNLEETVYKNNLEAAEEIARQLRLRDIGGIIVVDFIDMEVRENRNKVAVALRAALARDKTRTQVFDISDLGLVEMTRKRVSEGLVESLSGTCTVCGGRGTVLDESLL